MWIFMNDAFLSIVAHRADIHHLLVRARREGDIQAAFPGYDVETTSNADYRYRAMIPRSEVATVIAGKLLNLNYDNFKNSVPDNPRHDAYFGVWHVMNRYQDKMATPDLFVDDIDELSGQLDDFFDPHIVDQHGRF